MNPRQQLMVAMPKKLEEKSTQTNTKKKSHKAVMHVIIKVLLTGDGIDQHAARWNGADISRH